MRFLSGVRQLGRAYQADLTRFTRWMRRHERTRILAVVSAIILLGDPFLALPSAAAATWHAIAGAQSSDEALQASVFFPSDLTINLGDSISWTFATGEPHTFTLASPTGALETTEPAQCNGAPSSSNQCSWNGTSEVNSGLITFDGTRPRPGFYGASGNYTVTFTTVGAYPFLCLAHPSMKGTVHVQAAGTPYPHDQSFYDQQASQQGQQESPNWPRSLVKKQLTRLRVRRIR